MFPLRIRIVGNACITKYNNGDGATLNEIIEANFPALSDADKQLVRDYVASIRPDIPVGI
ncbi:hypothetical protein [Paenibacillus naphthalenovorans]|uniref:hypothetical protein n=1 Tax=Paenibacillus naphthalenovorans TaxID=162209 RepID=UPI003D27C4A5